jgi:hypothetical protein
MDILGMCPVQMMSGTFWRSSALYEDGDEDCNSRLVDHETGLDSATVDEVLDSVEV